MHGFEYPADPHQRRHGPAGYKDYESFRPWLRDEFVFRCVYCLHRERWNSDDIAFNIDHFTPVSVDPALKSFYDNLVYACGRCNRAKTNIVGIPDPCQIAFGECLKVTEIGAVAAQNEHGVKLCDAMALNAKKRVEARGRWMRALLRLQATDAELYGEYMGFPSDLDDLRPPKLRPPSNAMPQSVDDCFFAQREEGRLPCVY